MKKYNIIYDKKLKRFLILEEGEYVCLNLKMISSQLLKIMINSNIKYCENSEDEEVQKYAKLFASVSKHKVYLATATKISNIL